MSTKRKRAAKVWGKGAGQPRMPEDAPYTEKQLATLVLGRMSAGESVRAICADLKVNRNTVLGILRRPEYAVEYQVASEMQGHAIYDEIVELEKRLETEDLSKEQVSALRASLDAKKWRAACMHRGKYHLTSKVEVSGTIGTYVAVVPAKQDRVQWTETSRLAGRN